MRITGRILGASDETCTVMKMAAGRSPGILETSVSAGRDSRRTANHNDVPRTKTLDNRLELALPALFWTAFELSHNAANCVVTSRRLATTIRNTDLIEQADRIHIRKCFWNEPETAEAMMLSEAEGCCKLLGTCRKRARSSVG